MSSEKENLSYGAIAQRKYRAAHPGVGAAYQAEYRKRHKKNLREMKRRWAINASPEAKEHQREYRRVWEKENRIRKEAYRIKSKFKMATVDEAEILVRRREAGTCECCSASGVDRRLMHIDHDHRTGKIRSVLCNKCNVALGLVNDSIGHLQKLIAYLDRH